jgi:hypothetical protein
MKEKQIPLPGLLNFLQEVRTFSPFYSLDGLLKEFIEKNKLDSIKTRMNTSKGIIITLKNKSQFLIYSELKDDGNIFYPLIGGPGKHTSRSMNYCLKGKLNSKKIELKAYVSETQKYRMEKNPGSPCFADIPVKDGEPQVYKVRKDIEDYWFVTESNINITALGERLKKSAEKHFKKYDGARRETAIRARKVYLD